MKNREIVSILSEIADFLELRDVDYKPSAYRSAARNAESLSEPIEDVYERRELQEIEGVGGSIGERIAEYLETGELAYDGELRAELPVDIEAITSVEGVGPKTAKALYRELDVRTLEDLEAAARDRSPSSRGSASGPNRISSSTSTGPWQGRNGCSLAGHSPSPET